MQIEAQKPQLIDLYPVFRPLYRLLPAWLDSYKMLLNELNRLELPTLLKLVQKTKDKLASGKVSPSKLPPVAVHLVSANTWYSLESFTDKTSNRLRQ